MVKTDRFAGIWLDLREARIVFLTSDGEAEIKVIASEIDEGKAKGGSRSKTPWGPMDRVSEPSHQRRREQQIKDYLQRIVTALRGVSEVAIIGPGEAKIRFSQHLKDLPGQNILIHKVEAADSNLTTKQLIAGFRAMAKV